MQTDYTKKKLSSKIKKCPKCGRNGSYSSDVIDGKHGKVLFENYIHKSHPELGGIMRVIDEHCTIITPSNTVCTPTDCGLPTSDSLSTLAAISG